MEDRVFVLGSYHNCLNRPMGEGNSVLKDESRVVHQSFGREIQELH